MTNPNHVFSSSVCGKRGLNAAIAATNAIQTGQFGFALEQFGNERLGARGAVVSINGWQELQVRVFAGYYLLEAKQPLGMVAQCPAAEYDANATGPRSEKAAKPSRGRAAGGDIVDTYKVIAFRRRYE